jgi:hypothetical protein
MSKTQLRMTSGTSEQPREKDDYYATHPNAIQKLMDIEIFNEDIWEPACGQGHISKELIKERYNVFSTDLIDRGFGYQHDFLKSKEKFKSYKGDIITNPPYKLAQPFIETALDLVEEGNRVIMFLRLQFLEGKSRKKFFEENPPHTIYVSSSRIPCALNGDFVKYGKTSSVTAYAWFIWIKGYKGETTIKWFN